MRFGILTACPSGAYVYPHAGKRDDRARHSGQVRWRWHMPNQSMPPICRALAHLEKWAVSGAGSVSPVYGGRRRRCRQVRGRLGGPGDYA